MTVLMCRYGKWRTRASGSNRGANAVVRLSDFWSVFGDADGRSFDLPYSSHRQLLDRHLRRTSSLGFRGMLPLRFLRVSCPFWGRAWHISSVWCSAAVPVSCRVWVMCTCFWSRDGIFSSIWCGVSIVYTVGVFLCVLSLAKASSYRKTRVCPRFSRVLTVV